MSSPTTAAAVNASAVRMAALRSRFVAGLHPGEFGEAATYGVGDRVVGVQVRDDAVVVHVVSRWGTAASDLVADVRALVSAPALGRRIDVVIQDVQLPDEAHDAHRGSADSSA